VWEIWDKAKNEVLWISPGVSMFLRWAILISILMVFILSSSCLWHAYHDSLVLFLISFLSGLGR
jgi:hypothetical protein